jgi:hypothetical protein
MWGRTEEKRPEYPDELNRVIQELLDLTKKYESQVGDYIDAKAPLEKKVYQLKKQWLIDQGLLSKLTFAYDGTYSDRIYFNAVYDDDPPEHGQTSDEIENILNEALELWPHGSLSLEIEEEAEKSDLAIIGDDGSIRISFPVNLAPKRIHELLQKYKLNLKTDFLHDKINEAEATIARYREVIAFVEENNSEVGK